MPEARAHDCNPPYAETCGAFRDRNWYLVLPRPVGPDAEARIELRQTLDGAAALPDGYREPLLLAASGVSFDEIGAILGISANTVKIRVHRARLKLAAAIDAAARRLT